jgi:hypothetical protein
MQQTSTVFQLVVILINKESSLLNAIVVIEGGILRNLNAVSESSDCSDSASSWNYHFLK